MSYMTAFKRSFLLRGVLVAIFLGSLAACGGGGSADVGVIVPVRPRAIAPLTLVLTRVGPESIAVDWSDDPSVASFVVLRNGYVLATTTTTTTLIDNSVFINETYCYQVQGQDAVGNLVAATSNGCISIIP
ncbi:hypothetical protein [Polaromonas sp.]|uniref:hypothetical protein n=1 Tax=Polaromonas sp. TaxID=1869339 RepID=UPI0017B1CEFE|nr:hypothetical protein [Polaromonas sp.]NML87191.1 hypothetical protein [Polaromonas sp.]